MDDLVPGWTMKEYKLPSESDERAIHFPTPDIGYVVGYNGNILRTENGGKKWNKLEGNTELHLTCVHFPTSVVGYIGGQRLQNALNVESGKGAPLLKTVDGGENWSISYFPDKNFQDLHFYDANTGLAIADEGNEKLLMRTTDGGENWEITPFDLAPSDPKILVEGSLTLIGGRDVLFRSDDQGITWSEVNPPSGIVNYSGEPYMASETVWYLNTYSEIFRTTDAGITWELTDLPRYDLIHFSTENEGFLIKSYSEYLGGDFPTYTGLRVFQTTDGGNTVTSSDLIETCRVTGRISNFPQRTLGYSTNHHYLFRFEKN